MTGALPLVRDELISLRQGAGGRAMRLLIEQCLAAGVPAAPAATVGLAQMDDGAAFPVGDQWLVLTTDSHVVHPIVFPGGDIGRLAGAGTGNDLGMMGATEPMGLTSAVVIEEGFRRDLLERIQLSMRDACREAGRAVGSGEGGGTGGGA